MIYSNDSEEIVVKNIVKKSLHLLEFYKLYLFILFRKRYRNEGSPSPRQSPKRRREHSPDSDTYNSGDDKSKQNLFSVSLYSYSFVTLEPFFDISRK